MKITTTILLVVVAILCSCTEQGEFAVIEKWDNGSKKVTHTFGDPNDTTTYMRTFFHINGIVGTKGKIVAGKQDGLWEWWYENGNRQDLAHLNMGSYSGERKHWREDGTLRQVEIIEGDCIEECCDGKLIFYNDNGIKLLKYNRKNGNYHGFGYGYHEDGSLERKFYYENGKKKGMSYEYYANGVNRASGMYEEDLEQGKWTYRDSLGIIDGYEYFENGKSIKFEEIHH